MARIIFSNIKPGDVIRIDPTDIIPEGCTSVNIIDNILPCTIKGTWNEDHTEFYVDSISSDSIISLNVEAT